MTHLYTFVLSTFQSAEIERSLYYSVAIFSGYLIPTLGKTSFLKENAEKNLNHLPLFPDFFPKRFS